MMAGTQQPHVGLMTEDEVRLYFLQNGGLVRNNDIVTYFRTYLANPSIRDEARAVFKTIVNKLATVKVENGEKYLVLKRQYFQSALDGNGNTSGLPPMTSNPHASSYGLSYGHAQAPSSIGPPAYHPPPGNYPATSFPQQQQPTQQSFTPFPYQAPPPYVSTGAYPQIQQQGPMPKAHVPSSYHELSKSQPMLHGSQFSLNSTASTYGDGYGLPTSPSQPTFSKSSGSSLYSSPKSQQLGPAGDNDYGLPPAPAMSQNKIAPPRRLSFSSPSSSSTSSSPGGGRMIPPPYRPPPPAPAYLTSPPKTLNITGAGIRIPSFRSPGFNQQLTGSSSRVEPFPAFHYQRSLSVSGISGLPTSPVVVANKGCHSASPSSEHRPFFPQQALLQSPPPPVPPRTKRSSSFLDKSSRVGSFSSASTVAMDELGSGTNLRNKGSSGSSSETESSSNTNDKENASPPNNPNDEDYDGSSVNETEPSTSEAEQKISVKERMQKFNKISSESDLAPKVPNGGVSLRNKRENGNKHDSGDFDTSSLSSYGCYAQTEPKGREWILKAARSDYAGLNKMAQENPSLVKRKDINYTALHWASKLGQVDMVKLLAGTYKSDVHSKSNGGYTPLHLAAQFSRTEVYEILVKVYNADPNIRDHSGKKPMQYMVRQDTAVSVDTFKKLKEKRRSTEQRERDSNSFLRIGSLNVRVKKTTEAFGNFIGKSNSASNIERILNRKWGSTESLPESETVEKDKEMMPPPSGANVLTSKGKRSKPRKNSQQDGQNSPSALRKSSLADSTNSSRSQDLNSGSDSDTACGFGSGWKGN